MSAKAERLIDIVNWGKFQHYKDRRPPWIKNHASLLSDDAYLDLPLAARGVLHGLWLMRAERGGPIPEGRAVRTLGGAVSSAHGSAGARAGQVHAHLRMLNRAGFIVFLASGVLAPLDRERKTINRTSPRREQQPRETTLRRTVRRRPPHKPTPGEAAEDGPCEGRAADAGTRARETSDGDGWAAEFQRRLAEADAAGEGTA